MRHVLGSAHNIRAHARAHALRPDASAACNGLRAEAASLELLKRSSAYVTATLCLGAQPLGAQASSLCDLYPICPLTSGLQAETCSSSRA